MTHSPTRDNTSVAMALFAAALIAAIIMPLHSLLAICDARYVRNCEPAHRLRPNQTFRDGRHERLEADVVRVCVCVCGCARSRVTKAAGSRRCIAGLQATVGRAPY
jgi:hypothetical protein